MQESWISPRWWNLELSFLGKADVASKLHPAVEREVVVLPGVGGVLEVLDVEMLDLPVEEKDIWVVRRGHVIVDKEASVDNKSRPWLTRCLSRHYIPRHSFPLKS